MGDAANRHPEGAGSAVSALEATAGLDPSANQGFTIRVACDIGVRKANTEVTFPRQPGSMHELITQIQQSFIWDWVGDGRATPIDVSHILLWGDLDHEWRYLCRHEDLGPADQIYVFQKYQTQYTAGPLPPPRVRVDIGDRVNFREPGSVRIAADLFGRKVNYNMRYDQLPTTLDHLRVDAEKLLTGEALFVTPKGLAASDAVIEDMLLWDDSLDRWVDLRSARYLSDGAQVYCHQREVIEVESDMPAPAIAVPGGAMLSHLWKIFFTADVEKRGYLTPSDISHTFSHLGLQFPESSYRDMFEAMDLNQDGCAHFSEFCQLGVLYPSIVKYLNLMADEQQDHWKRRSNAMRVERDLKHQIHRTRVRESELLRHVEGLHEWRRKEEAEHRVALVATRASPYRVSHHAGGGRASTARPPKPHPNSIDGQIAGVPHSPHIASPAYAHHHNKLSSTAFMSHGGPPNPEGYSTRQY
eukprot:TRINITY_DN36150_c0_g1_i1.p1 TRINITY_DN36150_c0_g1~~TRINITY_DN36150_c0_g1_i1.p1  ORF type:complete len:471 (+),score=121.23 TRINITY_DN36150_c0_g1_i1:314-1726(+)